MSMLRTLKRSQERTSLGRECRLAQGRPAGIGRGKIIKKWQRARLKQARYARLIVGLLMRATGAVDDTVAPLVLVNRIPTPFQERAAMAERIIRGSDENHFDGPAVVVGDSVRDCDTGEGYTRRWVTGKPVTEIVDLAEACT